MDKKRFRHIGQDSAAFGASLIDCVLRRPYMRCFQNGGFRARSFFSTIHLCFKLVGARILCGVKAHSTFAVFGNHIPKPSGMDIMLPRRFAPLHHKAPMWGGGEIARSKLQSSPVQIALSARLYSVGKCGSDLLFRPSDWVVLREVTQTTPTFSGRGD